MPEENVEIIQRLFADWARGSFWSTEVFDPNVNFETFMPDASDDVRAQGLNGLAAFMQDWFLTWRDYKLIGDEFRAVGDDRVFVAGRQLATGRQSGVEVVSPLFAVVTLRRGKIVELAFHYDEARALEAAGIE